MKILHIINSLGSGGAERLLSEILPLTGKNKNTEIEILLLTDEGNVFENKLLEADIKILVLPLKRPRNPLNILYIRKYIISGNYDIIHTHIFPSMYWVSLASKLIIQNKPKFIYTEHSTYNKRRGKKYFRLLERWIYSSFDKVISISNATKKELIKWLMPVDDSEKFIVINNGINIDTFKQAVPYKKEELNSNFNDNTKLLIMVGSFTEAKDQATLIKSMAKIPKNIHLLLIGEGPNKLMNKKLAQDLNISNRVHFLGFRDDIERLLKTSDIIIQSSYWEGFGLSALEGMASGKLVLVTNVSGMSELVADTNLMFEPGNYNELSLKIKKYLTNQDLYKSKIKYLSERSELFNITITVDQYHTLYSRILKTKHFI